LGISDVGFDGLWAAIAGQVAQLLGQGQQGLDLGLRVSGFRSPLARLDWTMRWFGRGLGKLISLDTGCGRC